MVVEDVCGPDPLLAISVRTLGRATLTLNGESPQWGRGGIAFTRRSSRGSFRRHLFVIGRPAGHTSLLATRGSYVAVAWSADGRRLLALSGTFDPFDPKYHASIVMPRAGTAAKLTPTFSEVDALSDDGTEVLAVIGGNRRSLTGKVSGGNIVSVSSGGVRVLAHGALSASWTR